MLPFTAPVAESVLLGVVAPDDVVSLAALWRAPDVRRYLGGPVGMEESLRRSARYAGRPGAFSVRLPTASEPIGVVMVEPHSSGEYEVSYMFRPEAGGRGHARAAVSAVLAWALTDGGLERVIAVTQAANVRSLALLSHVGMVKEREVIEYGERQVVLALERRTAR